MSDTAGQAPERRLLGASGVEVSALGFGTDSWGAKLLGYSRSFGDEDLYGAYRTALDAGIDFFDTAPAYGRGKSEELLGRFRRQDGRPILIATKYDNPPFPIPLLKSPSPKALVQSLDASLGRLGVERIDLYQIHYPVPVRRIDEFADALAAAVRAGKVRAIGVSNFNAPLMRAMHTALARCGLPLASNQVAFNLLDSSIAINGVLEACRQLDVALIPCVPLAAGILSGKHWSGEAPISGVQQAYLRQGKSDPFHLRTPQTQGRSKEGRMKRALAPPPAMKNLGALFTTMQTIAETRDKSLVQVALNWLLTADPLVIPIPGAKNADQALENAGALGWRLTPAERLSLSQAGAGGGC
ncbi:MAG: aldo/keto reductase [Thermoleophilia bacterium]|nr:aldo/keto reductase [Thermoleophilia bacterium]